MCVWLQTKMRQLCGYYSSLIPQDKACFLKMLAMDYGIQQELVLQLAGNLIPAQVTAHLSLSRKGLLDGPRAFLCMFL